ncbi:LysM peptidoglycan-binding domain-containing protein [Sphingomonas sp. LR55]|uniref:LysM peptidoglycan-binding domain-containing protein n=1 Tax=Sphingomonas sp. LR55 TaxID=3050231 RepID=UPI002FE3D9CB
MRRASLFAVATVPLLGLVACIPQVERPAGYGTAPGQPYRDPPPRRDDQPRRDDDRPRRDNDRPRRDNDRPRRDNDRPRQDDDRPRRDDTPPQDIPGRDTGEVAALPAPRPAWEARPVSADAKTIPDSTYLVRPGDTLARVVDRSGASMEAIARANDLESPYTIRAGQRLTIPGGRYHQVRRGETGIAIARAYGVEWSRIVAANALVEPYVLRADQRIQIPDAPGAAGQVPRNARRRSSSTSTTSSPVASPRWRTIRRQLGRSRHRVACCRQTRSSPHQPGSQAAAFCGRSTASS